MLRVLLTGLSISLMTASAPAMEKTSTLQPIELASCGEADSECLEYRTKVEHDFPQALNGDYRAMWTVAIGMANGLGVSQNMVGSCTWASLAIMTGDTRVDDNAVAMAKNGCAKLDTAGLLAARQQFDGLAPKALKSPSAVFPFSPGILARP
ncbi:hypothetical protein [Kaistia sp. MMO-174]|uniref:hypothetical protein n=1 Tax=Kaistia sp. MMO-174 TaxID=3081256 RepID=UPI0030172432